MSKEVSSRSSNQVASAAVGMILMVISAPCVMAMVHDIITRADNLSGAIIAGTFFAMLGCVGFVMTYLGLKKPKAEAFAMSSKLERRLLQFAREHEGRITVSQLAVESPMSVAECQKALHTLEMGNICRSELQTNGATVYLFPDFMPSDSSAATMFDFDQRLSEGEEVADEVSQAQASRRDDW